MDEIAPLSQVNAVTGTRSLRRIIIVTALVLAVLILLGVAIYVGAFVILAPMMQ
ncbi:MAG: hypothetical protein QOF67_2679 [Mycobacterium sp.]|nr:hypothetical protein [Mycobacterium sp.]